MQRTTPSSEELARIGISAMPIPQETIDLLLRIYAIPRETLYELALRTTLTHEALEALAWQVAKQARKDGGEACGY